MNNFDDIEIDLNNLNNIKNDWDDYDFRYYFGYDDDYYDDYWIRDLSGRPIMPRDEMPEDGIIFIENPIYV